MDFCGQGSTGSTFFCKKRVKDIFFYLTLTDFHMHRQKLDIILESKVFQKLKNNIAIIYSSTKNIFKRIKLILKQKKRL